MNRLVFIIACVAAVIFYALVGFQGTNTLGVTNLNAAREFASGGELLASHHVMFNLINAGLMKVFGGSLYTVWFSSLLGCGLAAGFIARTLERRYYSAIGAAFFVCSATATAAASTLGPTGWAMAAIAAIYHGSRNKSAWSTVCVALGGVYLIIDHPLAVIFGIPWLIQTMDWRDIEGESGTTEGMEMAWQTLWVLAVIFLAPLVVFNAFGSIKEGALRWANLVLIRPSIPAFEWFGTWYETARPPVWTGAVLLVAEVAVWILALAAFAIWQRRSDTAVRWWLLAILAYLVTPWICRGPTYGQIDLIACLMPLICVWAGEGSQAAVGRFHERVRTAATVCVVAVTAVSTLLSADLPWSAKSLAVGGRAGWAAADGAPNPHQIVPLKLVEELDSVSGKPYARVLFEYAEAGVIENVTVSDESQATHKVRLPTRRQPKPTAPLEVVGRTSRPYAWTDP